MKKAKKLILILMCLLLAQVAVPSLQAAQNVQAATVNNGLKKENGKYYYYNNGKKVTNRFVKVAVSKKADGTVVYKKMYFGAKGAAYTATETTGVIAKTIGDKKYGFDTKGYLLTKGLYVRKDTEKFLYIGTGGVYDAAVSAKFNRAAVYKNKYSTLASLLKQYNLKVKKTTTNSTCYPDSKYLGGKDYMYYYANFIISTVKDKNGKNELFMYTMSR